MHIGVCIFLTARTIRVDELARALEERGFESLFVPEHTHIPTSRRSPWPGGSELPDFYKRTLDPFVALAVAAAVTRRLRVGTGIALLTERDPILTAKESATLDLLSDGRFELGIGAGWNAEEMENHGTRFEDRFKVMTDRAKAIRTLWTEEIPEYHGPFVSFDPLWCDPKPVQKPHPPILIGGDTVHTLRRVVEYGSGWMPRGRDFADPKGQMARLARIAEEAKRDPATLTVSVFGAPSDEATLDGYREAGIDRALIALPSQGPEEVLPKLDAWARFAA
jgi:probable F420-dependent oxidoreductase